MSTSPHHTMLHALHLGRRTQGLTSPNPAAGCVIVKQGQIIGRGWTAIGGRPHAETQALAQASNAARGATAYVTLEPCAHHGKTPPCAEALIHAGIAEVVIATRDPDPRTSGKGIAMLQAAGIKVTEGVCMAEANYDHAGFFKRITQGLPLVTLKLALTCDGKMQPFNVLPSWLTIPPPPTTQRFTSPEALAYAHLLRVKHEAILVGSGTVLADNPRLDCRLPGLEYTSPKRYVLNRHGSIPENAACQPCNILAAPTLEENLKIIAQDGINSVLVEGGEIIALGLLEAELVDRIIVITAPEIQGAAEAKDMRTAIQPYLAGFTQNPHRMLGTDTLETYQHLNIIPQQPF